MGGNLMAYNKTKLSNMYNRQKIYKQAKKAIEKNNLFFIEDVIAFLQISKSAFYGHFRVGSNELNDIKNMLKRNII